MRILSWQVGAALLLVASTASAQTPIYGMDNFGARFYSSDVATFVASWTSIAGNTTFYPCIDFDENSGTGSEVLWANEYATPWPVVTFNLATGAQTAQGSMTGFGSESGCGLTCDVNGTWYWAMFNSAAYVTNLYVGDITTQTAALVGPISPTIQIDISIDSQGNMYGHSINDDALYSINTTTGTGTFIGPTTFAANYAQGMDFDWDTDTLYATHFNYTGVMDTRFGRFDLTTGALIFLDDTNPLNAEMEMACNGAPGSGPGSPFGFGDVGSGGCTACGNNNDGSTPLGGCQHMEAAPGDVLEPAGARLDAAGNPSISADTLSLTITRGPWNNFGIFFQMAPGGAYIPNFWDGILVSSSVEARLEIFNTGTSGGTNDATSSVPIAATSAAMGWPIAPGQQKYYQAWYRDPGVSPCGTFSNTTNGWDLVWAP